MSTATAPTPVSAALADLLDRARPASSLAAEQPLTAPTFPTWKGTASHLSSRLGVAVAVVLALLVALVAPGLASGLDGSPADHVSGVGAASAEAHPALQSPTVETRVRASSLAGGTRVGAETADLARAHSGSSPLYDRAASGWLVAPGALGTAGRFSIHPRVVGQLDEARLGPLAGRFGPDDLQDLMHGPGARPFFDASTGNINVIQEIDGVLLRITTAADDFRIISVGRLRPNQLLNGIDNGRFVPIGPGG